ncbi:polynucleotide kinase [Gordonia phage VanLee]|uniref:Polynucleotide kinase n=1 Tax=Gordonia phage VanLee TaxID=2845816 RepID=A0A8F2IFH0_9CAUD|nr:polynucleotide kinase [Gordonia phage VanLee]QWS68231.1 polynucleotide kinase [Gordonia phage VanLee]
MFDTNTPALIVDIDGTLARRGDRGPYDYERVGDDTPHWPVVNLVKDLHRYHNIVTNQRLVIFVLSGRPNTCIAQTSAWLERYHIPYDHLIMRDPADVTREGNMRPDVEIKRDMYHQFIAPGHEVLFVLDDRDSVVAMWRELGLTCMQVAPGAF